MKTYNDIYLLLWLSEVTRDLCDEARERVTQEIRAHYADRVAAELALGRSEDEAHDLATAGLGSSVAARKAYKRVHLTKGDEQFFGAVSASKSAWRIGSFLVLNGLLVLSVCLPAMTYYLGHRAYHASPLVLVSYCILLPASVCALTLGAYGDWRAPGLCRRGRLRAAVAWYCIGMFGGVSGQAALIAAMFLRAGASDRNAAIGGMACAAGMVILSAIVSAWLYLHLSRKLGDATRLACPGGTRA